MIVINKSTSKVYNFYKTLSKILIFKQLTPKEEVDYIFTDICTFFRTTLFYILIGIPLYLITLLLLLVIIYTTISYACDGLINLFVVGCLSLYSVIWFVSWLIKKQENSYVESKDPSWLKLMTMSVKAKHDRLCKQIKLKE